MVDDVKPAAIRLPTGSLPRRAAALQLGQPNARDALSILERGQYVDSALTRSSGFSDDVDAHVGNRRETRVSVNGMSMETAPEPPYYAVIFTSQRTEDDEGYEQMAERMVELAARQPGFLGIDSVRDADGRGITVSYWTSEEAIAAWKAHLEHRAAQQEGMRRWYSHYSVRVARVERAYERAMP